jgi:GDP-L-fucose synthase
MNTNSKIYVAGHNGMLGSAICRGLEKHGYFNILTESRENLDLCSTQQVESFFLKNKPEYVILAAAKVGGINANIKSPVEFLQDNLLIQSNVISRSYLHKTQKLLFLGSSCIYPKECLQPMREDYLLSGKLEPTNEGYAIAKIAGLKLAEYYNKQYSLNTISLMPCNLYGPNDSFDIEHSHVLSALVKRFVDAKNDCLPTITLWGTGQARREFMHVDDAAEAVIYFMNHYDKHEFTNIGWGNDISIKELADKIAIQVGFEGEILWDTSKPDGMMKKCMDVSKMRDFGFNPTITLEEGITQMISIYKSKYQSIV